MGDDKAKAGVPQSPGGPALGKPSLQVSNPRTQRSEVVSGRWLEWAMRGRQLLGHRSFRGAHRNPQRTLCASSVYSLIHLIHKHLVGSAAGRLLGALLAPLRSHTRAKPINTRREDVLEADRHRSRLGGGTSAGASRPGPGPLGGAGRRELEGPGGGVGAASGEEGDGTARSALLPLPAGAGQHFPLQGTPNT